MGEQYRRYFMRSIPPVIFFVRPQKTRSEAGLGADGKVLQSAD